MSQNDGFTGQVAFRDNFSIRGPIREVVFDWDGTLSFIRAGWAEVMQKQWLEELPPLPGESMEERRRWIHSEIWGLNGRPSIHQAARLSEWIVERGGTARTARDYEEDYQQRLGLMIDSRREAARTGKPHPDAWVVPGARAFLDALSKTGVGLHVLSGTQRRFVVEEAGILNLNSFFGDRIHGPASFDDRAFSKRTALEEILRRTECPAEGLLAFGDGHVEIQETKALGGTAVAIATDEGRFGSGQMDEAKRSRLMGLGADLCLPDFRDFEALISHWFSLRHARP